MTNETTPETLPLVGWYCWRCQAINAQACRSDAVPIHVPAEWADDMRREIAKREDEDDEQDAGSKADVLAAELCRRARRLDGLFADPDTSSAVVDSVRGEVIGLRGALGIVLGGAVQGGSADALAAGFYQAWLGRQGEEG